MFEFEQNHWCANVNLTIDGFYEVDTATGTYKNIILNTDPATHTIFLSRGSFILRLKNLSVMKTCIFYNVINACDSVISPANERLLQTVRNVPKTMSRKIERFKQEGNESQYWT